MSDTVTWYLLLVGGGSYPVELVKVRKSWPRHHAPKKKKWCIDVVNLDRILSLEVQTSYARPQMTFG